MKLIKTLCIFHKENNPSLFIYVNKQFKCYGCGIVGNIIENEKLIDIYNRELYKHIDKIGQLKLFEI